MSQTQTLVVPGTAAGLAEAERGLDDFSSAHGLDRNDTWPFHVALDELLSNVVKYGQGPDGEGARIEVRLRLQGEALEMVVLDDGPAFDPLGAAAPDTVASLDERPIGGLGIEIVRRLMDNIEYARLDDGHNCLTMRRRLGL